jgi:hypothetical protein
MLPEDDATRAALAKAMKDPDAEVRVAAAVAAWRLGGEAAPTVRTLRAALAGAKVVEAARGLGRLGPAAAPAVPDLIEARRSGSVRMQIAAIEALERFVRTRGIALGERADELAKAPKEVRAAVGKGLAWLARHQDTKASGVNGGDGKWDSDDFAEHDSNPDTTQQLGFKDYDVGLTGLALLAMMAAGNSETSGKYAANVTEGLDYLLRHQRADGLFYADGITRYLVQHGIATHALAEACLLGSTRYRRPLERAVHYIEWARNPYMAWRYEPRGGENDTHVTTWMVTALRFAEACGVSVDRDGFQGTLMWIDKMTEPNFGQTGYNYPGGLPDRLRGSAERFSAYKSQAMTAAAIWARMMAGASLDGKIVDKGLGLIAEIPPREDEGYTDLYYWHYGSLVMIHAGKATQRRDWERGLRNVLLARQLDDGAWRADGAWGPTAGRVWSTTMATLALLSPYRYPEGFLGTRKLRGPYKEAYQELRKATHSSDDAVERAAERAMANLSAGR